MTIEDEIIFSQYFYLRKDIKNSRIDFYDNALSFIMNSKEVKDSSLKISDEESRCEILGLVVSPISQYTFSCRFSMMYCVSDGVNFENRTMDGLLLFNVYNSIELIGNIERFNKNGFIGSSELIEKFYVKDGSYQRYFNYGGTEYYGNEYIDSKDFERVNEFKENVVKLMRSRKI